MKTSSFVTAVLYTIIIIKSIDAKTIPEHTEDTQRISINFTNTLPLKNIWPSDGFILKYNLVDNRKSPDGIYVVDFTVTIPHDYSHSNDSLTKSIHKTWNSTYTYDVAPNLTYTYQWNSNIITQHIILNTSSCKCNNFACDDCKQHVYLFDALTEMDLRATNRWDFRLSHSYSFPVSVLPKIMPVYLQRCNISLYQYVDKSNKCHIDTIPFNFSLSQNCLSRVGQTFIVNVSISVMTLLDDIYNGQLIININNETSKLCKICEIKQDNITDCNHLQQDTFTAHLIANISDEDWTFIDYSSDQIDVYLKSLFEYMDSEECDKQISETDSFWATTGTCIAFFFCCLICCCTYYGNYRTQQYAKLMKAAFPVDKVMVVIIGISQFDKKECMLDGVRKNVTDLVGLWKDQYQYDVFVCNQSELYCTKKDVMQFIAEQKAKLESNDYQSVIVHVISHGSNEGHSVLSSDHQDIKLEEIRHYLIGNENSDKPLIKILFNHSCRGENNYQCGKSRGDNSHSDKQCPQEIYDYDMQVKPEDSNWAVVWANITSRTVSDDGNFTDCICKVFSKNMEQSGIKKYFNKKRRKKYFRELITDIRVMLQSRTDGAEICDLSETLNESNILFKPVTTKRTQYAVQNRIIDQDLKSVAMVSTSKKTYIDRTALLSLQYVQIEKQ